MPTNRFYKTTISSDDIPRMIKSLPPSYLFHTNLTDDGSTDYTLNEDYSVTAATPTLTATAPCVVQTLVLEMLDGDIAQNAVLSHELWVGANAALTNGLKLKVTNSAGTTLLNIWETVPIKALAQLDSISQFVDESSDVSSGTTGNNHHAYACRVNFEHLFGKAVELSLGDKLVLTLNDDFSGLAAFRAHVWGYLL